MFIVNIYNESVNFPAKYDDGYNIRGLSYV